jgi:hypothetical protein
MLSILTAAETEMYESSKKQEESQQMQKSGTIKPPMRDAECSVTLIDPAEYADIERSMRDFKSKTLKDSQDASQTMTKLKGDNEQLQE